MSDEEVKPTVENKKRKSEVAEEGSSSGKDGVATDDGVAWELGGNKFLRVKQFKGKTYVDIREFYEDKNTGEKKPGNKGIMLNMQHWKIINESLEKINDEIEKSK